MILVIIYFQIKPNTRLDLVQLTNSRSYRFHSFLFLRLHAVRSWKSFSHSLIQCSRRWSKKKQRKNKKEKPWKATAILFRELISAVTNVKNYRLQCRRATCNSALPFYVVLFSKRLETLVYFTLWLYQSTQNENAFETVFVILYSSTSCSASLFFLWFSIFHWKPFTLNKQSIFCTLDAPQYFHIFFYCTCNHFL